jgi:hypothetical protein
VPAQVMLVGRANYFVASVSQDGLEGLRTFSCPSTHGTQRLTPQFAYNSKAMLATELGNDCGLFLLSGDRAVQLAKTAGFNLPPTMDPAGNIYSRTKDGLVKLTKNDVTKTFTLEKLFERTDYYQIKYCAGYVAAGGTHGDIVYWFSPTRSATRVSERVGDIKGVAGSYVIAGSLSNVNAARVCAWEPCANSATEEWELASLLCTTADADSTYLMSGAGRTIKIWKIGPDLSPWEIAEFPAKLLNGFAVQSMARVAEVFIVAFGNSLIVGSGNSWNTAPLPEAVYYVRELPAQFFGS